MDSADLHGVLASPGPLLNHAELTDVVEIAAWAGQLMLQNGADSERVERVVQMMGLGLGCNGLDVAVFSNTIIITTVSGAEFRTKVRRIPAWQVNMTIVSGVNRLSRRVVTDGLDRFEVRKELNRIAHLPQHYNRWLVVAMVGLACASFSHLFGGDWPVSAVTFAAATVATVIRQELVRRRFNQFLVTIVTAFAAGVVASMGPRLGWGNSPELALVCSVLLLVPGVPLINSAQDFLNGYPMMGVARGVVGLLISLSIALGLLLAMQLMGVSGL